MLNRGWRVEAGLAVRGGASVLRWGSRFEEPSLGNLVGVLRLQAAQGGKLRFGAKAWARQLAEGETSRRSKGDSITHKGSIKN